MIFRSVAPLRLGLAGGGTDVSPYVDRFGGAVVNASINLFAKATLEPSTNGEIKLFINNDLVYHTESVISIEPEKPFELFAGVYNRIMKDFGLEPLSFNLSCSIDAPPGSGLGSSSTMVVAILGAFNEWLNLGMDKAQIALLAFEIEREDLKMAGGKQDQYTASYGGLNFMHFREEGSVDVQKINVEKELLNKLSNNLFLFHTKTSRYSSDIIKEQSANIEHNNDDSLSATHQIKSHAYKMKQLLLNNDLEGIGRLLHDGWKSKKQMAKKISNSLLDNYYKNAIECGALGGKISGAGGGGFMMFYCEPANQQRLIKKLEDLGADLSVYRFTDQGLQVHQEK